MIDGVDNQSFEITEDTTEHWRIELNATDLDTVSEELLWEVKVSPVMAFEFGRERSKCRG